MRKLLILIVILLITGCDLLDLTDDEITSENLTPQMVFSSSITDDNSKIDSLNIQFLYDNSPQEISRATINSSNLTYDTINKRYSTAVTFNESEEYTIECYINEGQYNAEIISDNTIVINQLPSFQIKIASSISKLINATPIDYIASIENTNVVGIVFSDVSGYTVDGIAKVSSSSTGNESKEYEINNNWFISTSLLNGEAVGFLPDTLYLEATFSYNGSLSSSFSSGYIRRTITITKEIQLLDN